MVGCGTSREVYPSRVTFTTCIQLLHSCWPRALLAGILMVGAARAAFSASRVELSHFQNVTESKRKRRAGRHASPAVVPAWSQKRVRVTLKHRSNKKDKPLLLRPLLGKLSSPVNVRDPRKTPSHLYSRYSVVRSDWLLEVESQQTLVCFLQ